MISDQGHSLKSILSSFFVTFPLISLVFLRKQDRCQRAAQILSLVNTKEIKGKLEKNTDKMDFRECPWSEIIYVVPTSLLSI